MFHITDRAAKLLKTALSKADVPESTCFRVGVADNKVKLAVDEERPGDTTIEHEGEPLVIFDTAVGNLLRDRVLDFGEPRSGLILKEAE